MKVIALSENAFDLSSKKLKSGGLTEPTIVFIYANWCGHCRRFMPIYNDASKILGSMVKLYKIDSDKNQTFIKKFGITSFPTLLIFDKNGKLKGEYTGERSSVSGFTGAICKISMKCK
jgi:thiol-disulfide isomerase/thioredoxin